jgi:hypothetical protein
MASLSWFPPLELTIQQRWTRHRYTRGRAVVLVLFRAAGAIQHTRPTALSSDAEEGWSVIPTESRLIAITSGVRGSQAKDVGRPQSQTSWRGRQSRAWVPLQVLSHHAELRSHFNERHLCVDFVGLARELETVVGVFSKFLRRWHTKWPTSLEIVRFPCH